MAKYRTNFELGLTDVDIIEESLSQRASALAQAIHDSAGDAANESVAALRQQLNTVRTLLGRIHNQKIWYQPESYVPQG